MQNVYAEGDLDIYSSVNMENKVDKYVEKFIGKNIAGAQISITKAGKIIFSKGYGHSDIAKNELVTTSSTFNYASISKLFIWTSAVQLKEQGKLDLNKNIKEYLPNDFTIKTNFDKPVTFLNLMNHNAGFDDSFLGNDGNCESFEEALMKCCDITQCFEPGEIQGYSNYSANLAAFIIERITGKPFYKYVDENICKVCGMNCCYPEKMPIGNVLKNKVKGYTCTSYGIFKETGCHFRNCLYPSGSAVGTAEDLSAFAKALMPHGGKTTPLFKSNETLNEMFSISNTDTGKELFSVHHGFWGTDGNYRGIGHTGCVEGMTSNFVMIPKENLSISVLTNDQEGEDITYGLIWMLTGTDYNEIDDKSNFPDSKVLQGKYVNARTKIYKRETPFDVYEIESVENNKIKVTANGNTQYYKQIRPYLYENITATSGIELKRKIYFKVQDGKVIKGIISKNDLIPIERLKNINNGIVFIENCVVLCYNNLYFKL